VTTSHAAEPAPEHPPRPTLEQIEAAIAASSDAPYRTSDGRLPDEALDGLARKVEATPRVELPAPAPVDWEAHVLAIAERSRPKRQQAAREQTARQRRIEDARRQRTIGVTLDRLDRRFARFVEATVEHPQIAAWVAAARRGSRDGLVIRGPVGTGKTHAAVAAYRAVVSSGVLPSVAVAVPALLDGLRPGREAVEHLDACESARLLLLDDLAAERATDWTAETLYRLIDARYARRLPTIVTMNATGAMIRDSLGDRVASRLNGLGQHVVLDGPDRRTPSPH
jgi:DNA replication protein DnaC